MNREQVIEVILGVAQELGIYGDIGAEMTSSMARSFINKKNEENVSFENAVASLQEDSKIMYRVLMGDMELASCETESRAQLARDMLEWMARERNAHVSVIDDEDEYELDVEDVKTRLDTSALRIVDEDGNNVENKPDNELLDAGTAPESEDGPKKYSVAYTEDGVNRFTPETPDFDKAQLMYDVLYNDMNFDLNLVVDMENGEKTFIMLDEIYVTDTDGQYYDDEDMSFEDAVASLPEDSEVMEQ